MAQLSKRRGLEMVGESILQGGAEHSMEYFFIYYDVAGYASQIPPIKDHFADPFYDYFNKAIYVRHPEHTARWKDCGVYSAGYSFTYCFVHVSKT